MAGRKEESKGNDSQVQLHVHQAGYNLCEEELSSDTQ